ncbi:MAG: wax ester/triacylglycerol synthase family O-acyltransferase [Acidimicrobiales bacterium]|nr:wax ester/triacylglycerol synthase family O-acyltransferase [Acidimicrobiales bacterium]
MERLTGLDAAFLYLETPTHHLHVAMTMVLDPSTMPGGYSFDKIKDFIAKRLHLVPPFRRRLVQVPLNLHHPVWIEDPNFDIDNHVRRIGCPAPGGRRELGEMAGQIASTPLDRRRPLWEMWVVEGLKQDRIGIVTKVHHAAIDGASGAELMVHLFSMEADTPDPEPPPPTDPDHIPNEFELLGYAAASKFRRTMSLPRLLGSTAGAVNRVVQGRRDPNVIVGAAPLTAPRTSWNGPLSTSRDVGFARVPLNDIKEIKQVFGCTVNDVVLGLCAGTLREYMKGHGDLPDTPLVATCPVSVRPGGETDIGNRVSAMFTRLHTHEPDPVARIRAIQEVTAGAKHEHNAVGADMLQNWAEFAAPNTFNLAVRLYSGLGLTTSFRPIHNVIISNVPGPPFPLYYAGARMVAAYPMGPTMEGVGLNITVFSYEESVDFGFMVDRELVPDVWNMADGVRDALEELKVAAGLQPATKKPRSRSSAKAAGKSSPKGPPNGSTTTVSKPAAKTTSRTRKSPQAARKAPMRDTTA